MGIEDYFDIKNKTHQKYGKIILFFTCKIKKFDCSVEEVRGLLEEYLAILSKYEDVSICLDLRSLEEANKKSVWEGISEVTVYDKRIAKYAKQECILLNAPHLIWILNKILKIHVPIFRFKIVKDIPEGMEFIKTGMANGFEIEK